MQYEQPKDDDVTKRPTTQRRTQMVMFYVGNWRVTGKQLLTLLKARYRFIRCNVILHVVNIKKIKKESL